MVAVAANLSGKEMSVFHGLWQEHRVLALPPWAVTGSSTLLRGSSPNKERMKEKNV